MKDILIGASLGFLLAALGYVASELIDTQDDIPRLEDRLAGVDHRLEGERKALLDHAHIPTMGQVSDMTSKAVLES